jgi:ABC-type glycerol-3-phosphate transport system permease component
MLVSYCNINPSCHHHLLLEHISQQRGRKTMIEKRNFAVILIQWILRILVTLIAVVPIYSAIIVALTPNSNLLEPQLWPRYFEILNFKHAFSFISIAMYNSFFYAVIVTIVDILIAVPSAYALAKYRFRNKPIIMFFLLLTQMMAGIVVLPSLYSIFSRFGLVNNRIGTIIVLSGVNLALVVWILHGYFCTLPDEIEEAAMLDGATYLEMLFRIIFPISGPGIAVGAIFAFINAYNEFVIPLFMLTDTKQYPLTLLFYTLLTDTTTRWHILSAGSLIAIIPPVLLFTFFQKYIVQGLISGSVKS